MIGWPEVIGIAVAVLALWALVHGAEDPDRGDEHHVGANTLAHFTRQELRQGWDREAAGCGPWRSPKEIKALRRAKATEQTRVLRRAG